MVGEHGSIEGVQLLIKYNVNLDAVYHHQEAYQDDYALLLATESGL